MPRGEPWTEAVAAVCGWAFDTLPSLQEITTSAASANVASARVLEKCGFERIGSAVERWDKEADPVVLQLYRRDRGVAP